MSLLIAGPPPLQTNTTHDMLPNPRYRHENIVHLLDVVTDSEASITALVLPLGVYRFS